MFALRSDIKVLEFQEREQAKSIDEALNFMQVKAFTRQLIERI